MNRRLLSLYIHAIELRASGLQHDSQGLTMLAYALGAAAVLAPLAILLFAFGGETASLASEQTNQVLNSTP